MSTPSLDTCLARWVDAAPATRRPIAAAISACARSICEISDIVARGRLAGCMGETVLNRGAGNDQKQLDLIANEAMLSALTGTPVAAYASEEMDEPAPLDAAGSLLVAADPIDGSTNIDANVSIGTILSLLPAPGGDASAASFLQPGTRQLAAAFAVYGPQTTLFLTLGSGTDIFTLDRAAGALHLTTETVQLPWDTREFSINMSNYRHWPEPVRVYIDDCLKGSEGARGVDFNMRWTASPVADLSRILTGGGIYMYPGDARPGYETGRLRLIYEGNPLAFVIEQAGGAAFTEDMRIMELVPHALHQRVGVIMGSRNEVNYLIRLIAEPQSLTERSPLFSKRGLFRV